MDLVLGDYCNSFEDTAGGGAGDSVVGDALGLGFRSGETAEI